VKGLLIAYSLSPNKNVGALRPSYWAEEMSKQYPELSLDVITTVEGDETNEFKRFVVPNQSKSFWSFLIKDEGLTWRKDLKEFLNLKDLSKYQFVILTGGPFFHFSVGKIFRKRGIKVIMDFRDPFSYNPRFNEKGLKKWIKKWYERRFLRFANLVLTVNDVCHNYIGEKLELNRGILPNGYDERKIGDSDKMSAQSHELFYAGRFYWEPTLLFDVLYNQDLPLIHAGPELISNHPYVSSSKIRKLGMLSQADMYQALSEAGIGVVFTMDIPFESTTKIYDYIALNRKILIITKGTPGNGVLNRELANYPYYRWVSYSEGEIQQAINELHEMEVQETETSQFSRKNSLKLLVNYIRDVVDQ